MLGLYQVRRDLTAVRSRHSENVAITKRINKLLGQIAYLREPESPEHSEMLKQMVAKATEDFERQIG